MTIPEIRILLIALLIGSLLQPLAGAEEAGFKPLFNGKDLTDWVNVNGHQSTWTVRDGMIICSGIPNGVLRTTRHYENYILELEWKHLHPKGNAGLFIWTDALPIPGLTWMRAIEVQILVGLNTPNYTSHGDIFAIHGGKMTPDRPHPAGWMRCLPSQRRCKPVGQWNHYRLVCQDGTVKLAVNGKVVSGGSNCTPRKGYICLEAEGSEVHFRNLRIKELPTSNPPADQVATLEPGFRSLFSGIDLGGFKQEEGHKGHWKPVGGRLVYDGKSTAKDKNLWTEKSYGDFELIADWRWTAKPKKMQRPVILPSGDYVRNEQGQQKTVEVLDAGDSGIFLRGFPKSQVNIWCWPAGSGEVYSYRIDAKQPAEVRSGVTPKVKADRPIGQWNRFRITMVGDRLTVLLNGQKVLSEAQLPGIPKTGPLALQHHGDPIEFMNLYIRELE